MKLRKLLVVLFVLVCVVSLACFTACKDGGDVNDDGAGDQITDGGNDNVGDNNANDNVQPEQPEDPEEPEVPTDPEDPEVPTDPEEPEVPTDPEDPEVPTDPEEPEVPTDPEEPEVPTDPEEPEVPTDPEEPEVPTDPEEPEVPTDPEEPEVPTDPEEPEVPTDPEEPEQPEVSSTTIYFKSENGWTNANIWAWEGTVNHTGGTWPGSAMTDLGDGWFSYTFAEDVVPTNIIFNNGTAQTADLVFDGTNNYYAFNTMTGGTWGADNTVSAPVQESDCYLRGNVGVGETDWGIGKAMTYNGTDEYSIIVTVDAGAEVKVVYQGNWIGTEALKSGISVAIENAGGNIKFTNAGTYTIYYKVSGDVGIWIAAVEAEA